LLIEQLKGLFKEVEEKQIASEKQMEDTVKETTQKHAAFIQKLKNQVVTTKEENT